MANKVFNIDQQTKLLLDFNDCYVVDTPPDGSRIEFYVNGYERPAYRGQDTYRDESGFPVEGTMLDSDRSELNVSIFHDQNTRILEVELVKKNAECIVGPNWSTFKLL